MSDYKYKFSKKKTDCPSCGQKTFQGYDNLPAHFGRCERVNNCGYIHTANRQNLTEEGLQNTPIEKQQEQPIFWHFPSAINAVDFMKNKNNSNFRKFCKNKLSISEKHLDKWGIGADNKNRDTFLFYDEVSRYVNHKIGIYDAETGKRNKTFGFFSMKQKDQWNKFSLPLFGGQQLKDHNINTPVCVVESEKTAIICSYFYSDLIWVSCGSASGLSDGSHGSNDRLSMLENRQIWWICDGDSAGRNNSSIKNLKDKKISHKIIDIFKSNTDGYDLADAIIDGRKIDFFKAKIDTESGDIEYIVNKDFLFKSKEEEEYQKKEELKNKDLNHESLNIPEHIDMWEYLKNGYYEDNNKYYFRIKTKDSDSPVQMSNFTIKILYFIASNSNPKRILEMTNEQKETKLVAIDTELFTTVSKFNILCESKGNYIFWGNDVYLRMLKKNLFLKEKAASQINTLGWQTDGGFYAFANGIYNGQFVETDTYGIVKNGARNYFLPAFSKISDETEFENERRFVYKKSTLVFSEWASLFCKVYAEKNNGSMALLYYIAAVNRDIIQKRLKFFPILNLFGVPGSGKTTMGYSLTYMFGEKIEPYGLGNAGTPKGFVRKFAQITNGLIWLDEFKNSIGHNKIEAIKNIYDGVGYERAKMSQDNSTHSTPVRSASVMSGQELPTQDAALFKRVILLQFEKTDYKNDQKAIDNYNLLQVQEQLGLSSVTCEILLLRTQIETNFNQIFDKIFKDLTKSINTADDRILKNYAVLLTIYKCLESHLNFPLKYDDIFNTCVKNINIQNAAIATVNDTQKFWDMVEYLYSADLIKLDDDFKIVDKYLYVRLGKLYPLYAENFQRQTGYRGMDKSTLTKYLEMSPEFVERKDSTRFRTQVSSAIVFDYVKLGISLKKLSDIDYESELKKETKPMTEQEADTPFTEEEVTPF